MPVQIGLMIAVERGLQEGKIRFAAEEMYKIEHKKKEDAASEKNSVTLEKEDAASENKSVTLEKE